MTYLSYFYTVCIVPSNGTFTFRSKKGFQQANEAKPKQDSFSSSREREKIDVDENSTPQNCMRMQSPSDLRDSRG